MAFQAPFEIAQSQLRALRLTSVDSREAMGAIFPFFDEEGATRFLVIDTSQASGGGAWIVEEFPLEIRLRKAIYPRPIVRYRALADLDPTALGGFYHFDPLRSLARKPALADAFAGVLDAGNAALRVRANESIRDLFYTLDLRRLTGAVSRAGLFRRRRLELAALRTFLRDTESATA